MSEEIADPTRLANAVELLTMARYWCEVAAQSSDPVSRRRFMVKTAKKMRDAADNLDDHGRLTE